MPYDPAAEAQVSGAHLMIAAYAVVCGVVGLYALSLLLRSRSVARRARLLQRRAETRAGAGRESA